MLLPEPSQPALCANREARRARPPGLVEYRFRQFSAHIERARVSVLGHLSPVPHRPRHGVPCNRTGSRGYRHGQEVPIPDSCTAANIIVIDHLVGAAEQRQRDSDAVGCRRKNQQQNPAS